MTPNPSFDGQRLKAWCDVSKQLQTWVAKYRGGELYWWCHHGPAKREGLVVNRKPKLASKSKV